MLMSPRMTDSRQWGEEDYCTAGVKVIKKMERCHTGRLSGQDFKRGVFARLSHGDRTMALMLQLKTNTMLTSSPPYESEGICLQVTSAIKMLDLISYRFQFDYVIN